MASYLDQVPFWTAKYFGSTLREPLVAGVPIGLAFAWLYRRRAAALPARLTGQRVSRSGLPSLSINSRLEAVISR